MFLGESFVCLFFTFASYCCRELGQRTAPRLGQGDEGDNNGDYLDDDEHDGQYKHHDEDALDIHLRHVDLAIKTLVTTVIKFYDKTTRTAPAEKERKTLTHCQKKRQLTLLRELLDGQILLDACVSSVGQPLHSLTVV